MRNGERRERWESSLMETERADGLRQIVCCAPGFERRAEGYGIRSADLSFVIAGELGAVEFRVMTGWFTRAVRDEQRSIHSKSYPLAELFIHSSSPRWGGHVLADGACAFTGGDCYADSTAVGADPVFDALTDGGLGALWEKLVEAYWGYLDAADTEAES